MDFRARKKASKGDILALLLMLSTLMLSLSFPPIVQAAGKKQDPDPACVALVSDSIESGEKSFNLMRPDFFPEKYNVAHTDPYLRHAIYEIFGGIDFYSTQHSKIRLSRHRFEVDHVWPKNKGGPDNIYNYVLASRRSNGGKSDHMDRRVTNQRLAVVRNDYAQRVYNRYIELKNQGGKMKIAKGKRDMVQTILDATAFEKSVRTKMKKAILKSYYGKLNDLEAFTQRFVVVMDRFPGKERRAFTEARITNLVEAQLEYEIMEGQYNRNLNLDRMVETLFVLSPLRSDLKKIFSFLNGLSKNRFGSFKQLHDFLMSLIDSLEASEKASRSLWQRARNFRPLDPKTQAPGAKVLALLKEIFLITGYRADRQITPAQYAQGIQILSGEFTPDEIKTLITPLRDHRRERKIKGFSVICKKMLELRRSHPRHTVNQLLQLLNN